MTLVRGVLEKSKRMAFYKFYVTCGTGARVIIYEHLPKYPAIFTMESLSYCYYQNHFRFSFHFLTLITICKVKLKVPQFAQERKTPKDSDTRVV